VIFDATVEGRTLRVEVRGQDGRFDVVLDGRALVVDYRETGPDFVSLLIDGQSWDLGIEKRESGYGVVFSGGTLAVALQDATRGDVSVARKGPSGPARIAAPMPGKIVRVLVAAGDTVQPGQGFIVMEAMKMENEIRSPRAGRVQAVAVREGQAVETGALLAILE
jgi:biotin carboxyl carrier protein